MPLAVVGVSHHTAPIEVRERLAFAPGDAEGALARLREEVGVREAVLLSTCNRTEVYLFPARREEALRGVERLLERKAGRSPVELEGALFERWGDEAVRHLFEVCSGLDSLVIGEAEIQGQVRDAYEHTVGVPFDPPLAGPVLNRLFQTALAVGGRVRAETTLGEGAASVASVAVQLARKIFGSLTGKRVLILGAGQTGELVVRALAREGVHRVIVANRTYDRAVALAESVRGRALHFEELARGMEAADIVLASTAAPHPVVTEEVFGQAFPSGLRRPLLVIDLAVPRDVHPAIGGNPEVFLYNVDDLRRIVDEMVRLREGAVPHAERILQGHVDEFRTWYASRTVVPLIRRIRGRAERQRSRELDRLLRGLEHLSDEDRTRLEEFSRRLTNKLLHTPTARLRKGMGEGGAPDLVDAIRFLYGLEDSEAFPNGPGDLQDARPDDQTAAPRGGPNEGEA